MSEKRELRIGDERPGNLMEIREAAVKRLEEVGSDPQALKTAAMELATCLELAGGFLKWAAETAEDDPKLLRSVILNCLGRD